MSDASNPTYLLLSPLFKHEQVVNNFHMLDAILDAHPASSGGLV